MRREPRPHPPAPPRPAPPPPPPRTRYLPASHLLAAAGSAEQVDAKPIPKKGSTKAKKTVRGAGRAGEGGEGPAPGGAG
jgi:hypothetical protein